MIAEEKRKALLTAIAQTQDEQAFEKLAAIVEELLGPAAHAKAGFLRGSVSYHAADWDAPLPDADWNANAAAW